MRDRNSFVEILRILCIFGILLMHKNGFIIDGAVGGQIPWIMFVNVFNFESSLLMLISSYYGNPYAPRKRLFKLWFMVLFYTYASFVIGILKGGSCIGDPESLIRSICPITTGTSWFAAGYIMVWLVAPYLEKVVEHISRKEYLGLICILTTLFVVVPTFTLYGPISNTGKDVGTLLTFYCIGRYLRKYGNMADRKLVFYVAIALTMIMLQFLLNAFCVIAWHIIGKSGVIVPFSWDHSITELVLSIALLGISTKVYFTNKTVNFVGKRAFGILLSEGIASFPAMLFIGYENIQFGIIYVATVVLYVLVIMVEGIVIESVRRTIFGRLESIISDGIVRLYKKFLITYIVK